jgi:hypothetical protein
MKITCTNEEKQLLSTVLAKSGKCPLTQDCPDKMPCQKCIEENVNWNIANSTWEDNL